MKQELVDSFSGIFQKHLLRCSKTFFNWKNVQVIRNDIKFDILLVETLLIEKTSLANDLL